MPETQQAETDRKAATETTAVPDADADEPATTDEGPAQHESAEPTAWIRNRKKFLAGAATLVAAALAGTVLTFVLPEEESAPPPPYTVAATYKVTGEGKATITYNTGRTDAPGGREQHVELPWTKKVRVNPKSGLVRVSIVLDEDGGKAQCAVAVRGHHRQRATAFGDFGRATCSAKVPEMSSAQD